MTPRQENSIEREGVWKVDRHIPIALIFTVLAQGAVIVWWGSGMDSRLTQEAARNDRQDNQIEAVEAATASQQVGMATAAAELRAVRESLGEVKAAQVETNQLLREILTNGKAKP